MGVIRQMSKWIASRIESTKDKDGLEAAQEKYTLYFLLTNKMEVYKQETDSILIADGYEDCIVKEEE